MLCLACGPLKVAKETIGDCSSDFYYPDALTNTRTCHVVNWKNLTYHWKNWSDMFCSFVFCCFKYLYGWKKRWIIAFWKCTAYLVVIGEFAVGVLCAVAVHIWVCSVTVVVTETCILLLQEALTNLHRLIDIFVVSNLSVSGCCYINIKRVCCLCCLGGWYFCELVLVF